MILAKVCIVGEISVGKTSLIHRFVDRSFSDTYLATVGVKISRKRLQQSAPGMATPGGLQLVLWDLEGGESFDDMTSSYLKGARGAVIVGDVTRPSTIEAVERHVKRFLAINPRGVIVVALNKTDLDHDPGVLHHATGLDIPAILSTIQTSARSGEGVDEVFATLGAHILRGSRDGDQT
jgi:small GTP-binding protein